MTAPFDTVRQLGAYVASLDEVQVANLVHCAQLTAPDLEEMLARAEASRDPAKVAFASAAYVLHVAVCLAEAELAARLRLAGGPTS